MTYLGCPDRLLGVATGYPSSSFGRRRCLCCFSSRQGWKQGYDLLCLVWRLRPCWEKPSEGMNCHTHGGTYSNLRRFQAKKKLRCRMLSAIWPSLHDDWALNNGSVLIVQNNTDTSSALSLTWMKYASACIPRQTVREDRHHAKGLKLEVVDKFTYFRVVRTDDEIQ